VACCRADQPLTYGVEPLRLAHRRLRTQLDELDGSIPVDRTDERRAPCTAVADATTRLRHAERRLIEATLEHDELSRRRWPRRDSDAIGRAADRVETARHRLDEAGLALADARTNLGAVDAHQRRRRDVLVVTAGDRRNLTSELALVGDGLDRTRTDRILDIADRPRSTHLEVLGPVPATPAARAVWCAAAYRLETHVDTHSRGGPAWSELANELARTPELCAVADRYLRFDTPTARPVEWAHVADQAREIHNQLIIDRRLPGQQQIEHGIGLDIGF
jgi:hypothetical protein